jgi:hypothetical protein
MRSKMHCEGLVALGFAGANVTTPHKRAVAELVQAGLESVNTLVVRDGQLHGASTDAAILAEIEFQRRGDHRRRRAARAFATALPEALPFSRRADWPPDVTASTSSSTRRRSATSPLSNCTLGRR